MKLQNKLKIFTMSHTIPVPVLTTLVTFTLCDSAMLYMHRLATSNVIASRQRKLCLRHGCFKLWIRSSSYADTRLEKVMVMKDGFSVHIQLCG